MAAGKLSPCFYPPFTLPDEGGWDSSRGIQSATGGSTLTLPPPSLILLPPPCSMSRHRTLKRPKNCTVVSFSLQNDVFRGPPYTETAQSLHSCVMKRALNAFFGIDTEKAACFCGARINREQSGRNKAVRAAASERSISLCSRSASRGGPDYNPYDTIYRCLDYARHDKSKQTYIKALLIFPFRNVRLLLRKPDTPNLQEGLQTQFRAGHRLQGLLLPDRIRIRRECIHICP